MIDLQATDTPLPRLVPSAEVARLTTLSPRTIGRLVDEGTFPAPLRLADRRLAWTESALMGWMSALAGSAAQ